MCTKPKNQRHRRSQPAPHQVLGLEDFTQEGSTGSPRHSEGGHEKPSTEIRGWNTAASQEGGSASYIKYSNSRRKEKSADAEHRLGARSCGSPKTSELQQKPALGHELRRQDAGTVGAEPLQGVSLANAKRIEEQRFKRGPTSMTTK